MSANSSKLDLAQMRALAAALDMPKSARRIYGKHRIRYAKFQAEQDKILAGTHERIEDNRPLRRRNGKTLQPLDHVWKIPKARQPLCGARCRDGHECRRRVIEGKARCRNHGGLSTGPKTAAGRAAIVESNRRRAHARRGEK